MNRESKKKIKSVISALLVCIMSVGIIPAMPASAAQISEYVDPADHWLSSNGRNNELDMNATTTYETNYCAECEKETTVLCYRVPEYTRSGETALNRGVKYSDGTLIDGEGKGNLDDGTPGVDAKYTGYHFTKSVCQTCGTINSVDGKASYNYNKNVYGLNACDHNFFLDFDNTTYEPYSSTQHTSTLKSGQYCQFCKGTYAEAKSKREAHNFKETVDAQLGNNRFYIAEKCEDCGYESSEYVTAKSVIASYYGNVDGEAHTLTVSDLSENGVNTRIRYGTEADRCNRTSAPNYTTAGYYTVYYEIDYTYSGTTMTENGVSYVWLVDDNKNNGNGVIIIPPAHEHDYHYLETVAPSCTNLGYDRFQCSGCGDLIKTNYTPASGHSYKDVTIREATCKQGGLKLQMCTKCGDFHEETTPVSAHRYKTEKHNPTCKSVGYTDHICEVCGDNYITNITPLISHAYEHITKEPTCVDKGYTTYTCTMCGFNYISDYTEPTGHDWDDGHIITNSTCDGEGVMEYNCKNCSEKMIKATDATGHKAGKAATCTEPQVCEVCGTVLELPTGHHYDTEIIPPTCTAMGYTVYTCRDCSDTYTGDYTDKAEHDHNKTVTAPTCTQHGYTTYSCKNCDDEYESDYTEKLPHSYKEEITSPTCTSMGYTTYTCEDCKDSYVGNYTDMLEHNYNKQTVEPTCTEHGYAVYTCPDCGKSYIGDYTDAKDHHYTETVIPATCTEMGYSIFKCDDCGDEYKGNYTEQLGHRLSEWIIDTPATIEHGGEKHIECLVCGEVLKREGIPQLIDTDRSDEDGNAKVGAFSIILTDKDGRPIFDSEIVIDVNDNVTIKLPEGRLLDYADQTTITAFYTETQNPAIGLRIYIFDGNNNAATGATDGNGQLRVPNNQSSTGDDNGTIGGDNKDDKYTYVVTVTDKDAVVIPDCDIKIGDNHDIVVTLPDGVLMDTDNRVTVTVSDSDGKRQENINVIVIGQSDYIEKGITNANGQVTLPAKNQAFTDKNGIANVGSYIVSVEDETEPVYKALVTLEDGNILVCLPDGKEIDYHNRTTVTVKTSDGKAVSDMSVNVYDNAGGDRTEVTDENGKATVPPWNENIIEDNPTPVPTPTQKPGMETPKPSETEKPSETDAPDTTDKPTETEKPDTTEKPTETDKPSETEKPKPTVNPDEGSEVIAPDYSYKVSVRDNDGLISGTIVSVDKENGSVTVKLPEGKSITADNRIVTGVTDKAGKPINGVFVTVIAKDGTQAGDKTNSAGIAIVPPTSTDVTDKDGYAQVIENGNIYNVVVEDSKVKIENAAVEVKDGKISVLLPDGHKLDTSNQTTVTVTDKDNKAVQSINVTVTDKDKKTASQATNANGKITVPVKTSNGGGSSSGGSSGGGGGGYVKTTYNVKVTNKDGKSVNVSKSVKDDKITLTLPQGIMLDGKDYYTITVTDSKGKAADNIAVILKDKKDGTANGTTDKNGKLVLPASEHKSYIVGYPDGTFMPDGDMSRAEAAAIFARLIADEKGENISGKSSFSDVDKNGWYSDYIGYLAKYHIIEGYEDGTFKPDSPVTRAEFVAMSVRYYTLFNEVKKGGYTVKYTDVSKKYWAYDDIAYAKNIGWLNGYADGSFRGDNNITRAEVVTVVNHATLRVPDKEYIDKNVSTLNKFTDLRNNAHWGYYSIMESANTHKAVVSSDSETWVK